MPHTHLTPQAIFFGLSIYFCFTISDSLARLLMLQGYGQMQILGLIMGLAMLPVLTLIAYEKSWKQLRPAHPWLVLLRAVLACFELALVFYALRTLRLSEAYTLFFTMPLWAAVLAALFLKEHLHKRQMLALLLGFTGVLIANIQTNATTPLGWGQAAGLLAPLFGATGVIITRKVSTKDNGASLLLAMFAALCLFNTAFAGPGLPLTPQAVGLCLLASIAQGSAQVSILLAVRRAAAPLIAPFQYSQVLWGLVFGYALFGEWPQAQTLVGLMLICMGGWLLIRR